MKLGANLLELLHSSEDWVRIASLRRKSDVKLQLKYMISPKEKTKKHFFNCKTSCRINKIPVQNNLPATMEGKLAKLN